MVEKAQQLPHCPWFFTGVTASGEEQFDGHVCVILGLEYNSSLELRGDLRGDIS